MARRSPQTLGKRERERAKLEKRERKQQKKAAAAAARQAQPNPEGADPPPDDHTPSAAEGVAPVQSDDAAPLSGGAAGDDHAT
jgi:hypothetical protein